MTQTATKTRKLTEITSPVVYRINDKQGQCLGYLVPSDQEGVDPYKVTFNYEAHRYECNCKCGIESNHTVTCKHIRAVNSTVAARKEFHKQQETPAATAEPVETHRVSRVDGLTTRWYPEYRDGDEWFRYPQPDSDRAVSFVIEGRAERWLADRLAEVEGSKAESKMFAWKRAMDEQYASDPRTELAKQREAEEQAASNLRAYYDPRFD